MIHIWIWNVPLPPGAEWLAQPLASALATLLFWLVVAVILRVLISGFIKALARRSETEIDDVIVDVSGGPLIVAVVLAGAAFSVDALGVQSELAAGLRRWLVAGILAVASYWIWRLLKEVVLHYAEIFARRSETRADDVLVPIVNQFAPILIFGVGGAVILQYLGLRLDALLVAIGGAAFIMAFALQDILSNVFSGISLLVDTPFRYGDMITLADGKVCQVIKIGVRVTQLYDIGAHAVIYAPNSLLASERLTNLMQPTPELISIVPVHVGAENDPEAIRSMLNELLLGHPDLLGDVEAKVSHIGHFATLSEEKRAHGRDRLEAEARLDQAIAAAIADLRKFADAIRARERRGLTAQERAELLEIFQPIRRSIGWARVSGPRLGTFQGENEDFLDSIMPEMEANSVTRLLWAWVNLWGEDPDLLPDHDPQHLRSSWGERVLALLRRIETVATNLERGGGLELRLDDDVFSIVAWMRREFKQKTPAWKESGTGFKGLDGGGFLFRMLFYVDDIELEHFERQSRVEGQVRREAYRRLREKGISMPTPRYAISVEGGRRLSADEPFG